MKKSKWIACAVFLAMMCVFVQSVRAEDCVLQVTLKDSYPGLASVRGATVTVTNVQNGSQTTTTKELRKGTTPIPLDGSCAKEIRGFVYSQRGMDSAPKPHRIVPLAVRDPSGKACLPCLLQIEGSGAAGDFTFVTR